MNKFIAITNRTLYKIDYFEQIEKIADKRPESIILREKDLDICEYDEYAGKVFDICKEKNVELYIHTYVDIAKKYGIKNIHLPVHKLIECRGELKFFDNVSVSCHSEQDVLLAVDNGATRIILGTIFETACKVGLKGKGTDFLKEICEMTTLPVYAIGGVNETNIDAVLAAGARGGCMMSGFVN